MRGEVCFGRDEMEQKRKTKERLSFSSLFCGLKQLRASDWLNWLNAKQSKGSFEMETLKHCHQLFFHGDVSFRVDVVVRKPLGP